MEPEAPVLAELFAALCLNDVTLRLAEVARDELAELHLAQEANPLGVLAPRCRQLEALRVAAHLGLLQPREGEERAFHLLLPQVGEEVRLVLERVRTGGHARRRHGRVRASASLHIPSPQDPRVVAARDEPELSGLRVVVQIVVEAAELDAAVAEHVWVRSSPAPNLADAVLHHALPVLLGERHCAQLHSEGVARLLRVSQVLLPRALAPEVLEVFLEPNL
mmetsp:Transcript_2815/g.11278  ORF Transcript_2815/g.11278 Transcript_2815/m.11278 type:complete len:221 (-) Transcript_2815:235-897(-)